MAQVNIIGPAKAAAKLEGSKEFAKDFSLGSGIDLLWQGDVPAARSDVSGQGTLSGEHTDVYFVFASVYGVWKF